MRILAVDHAQDLYRELSRVGADEVCWDIFAAKHQSLAFHLPDLSTAGANILKQTAIGCGGDCAVHHGVASGRIRRSDAVLFVSRRRLPELCRRLVGQPDCVSRLVPGLLELERGRRNPSRAVAIAGRKLDLAARAHVMGIVNVTPDSFYEGGRWPDPERAAERAQELADEGADLIDIGAESTRPGSEPVLAAEQLRRLLPVLRRLSGRLRTPISVDTSSAAVARRALDEGAAMINDVSGLTADPKLGRVIARTGAPCVLMHLPAPPRTMQRRPRYRNLMAEILAHLDAAVERAVAAGISREQVIIDPGIGFGKSAADNIEIVRRLRELASLDRPVLLGPSRKTFIGTALDLPPRERLEGTLVACVLGARNGANILRVHDVKPVVRALKMLAAIEGSNRC